MRLIFKIGIAAVAPAFVVMNVLTQATDTSPLIGTWALNRERSSPESLERQSQVVRFRLSDDDFVTYTSVQTNRNGNPAFVAGAFKVDGESYPWYRSTDVHALTITGEPTPITRTWTRISDFVFQADAGEFGIERFTVSEDGSVMTWELSRDGTSESGPLVFDRVN